MFISRFTSLFCTERRRNVPKCKTHVHRIVLLIKTYCLVTFSLPLPLPSRVLVVVLKIANLALPPLVCLPAKMFPQFFYKVSLCFSFDEVAVRSPNSYACFNGLITVDEISRKLVMKISHPRLISSSHLSASVGHI